MILLSLGIVGLAYKSAISLNEYISHNYDIFQNNNLYGYIQNTQEYLNNLIEPLRSVEPLPKGASDTINRIGIYLHPDYQNIVKKLKGLDPEYIFEISEFIKKRVNTPYENEILKKLGQAFIQNGGY